MLGTLQKDDKVRWCDFVQPLVHSYNCTKNDTTGFFPYQLMFGRQPNLPTDKAFELNPEGQKRVTHTDYVKNLRENTVKRPLSATGRDITSKSESLFLKKETVSWSRLHIGGAALCTKL